MAVCEAGLGFGDYLTNFEFIKAFTCTYANAAGFLVVGLLVYGGISLSIYIETGSVIIPFVLLLTVGGAVLTQVAAPAMTIAVLVLLVTGGGVMAYLYHRYSR